MRYLVIVFMFCLSTSCFAQQLSIEPAALPVSLSVLEYSSFKDFLKPVNDLKTDIKPYALTTYELVQMRQGNILINPKSLNKNFTISQPPTIDLNKELRKVMHIVPGEFGPVRARGFTL